MQVIFVFMTMPLTAIIAVIAVTAFLIPASAEWLGIALTNPQQIQWYQLFGCHLLHWSAEHLFWDLMMFGILGGCCERWWPKSGYLTLLISALLIPLVVRVGQPEISSYRGLSGIDTALFSLLATRRGIESLRQSEWMETILFATLLTSLVVKVAYEFLSGDLWFVSEVNFVPLPLAHLVGGVVGTGVALLSCRLRTVTEACNNAPVIRSARAIPCCPLEPRCESVSSKFFELGRDVAAGAADAGGRC